MLQLRRGTPVQLPPPIEDFESQLTQQEQAMLEMITNCSAVGSVASVAQQMQDFIARTGANELMCVGSIYDHQKRVESFRLAAQARDSIS